VVVDVVPGTMLSMAMWGELSHELEAIFKRRIDLSIRGHLPPHYLRTIEPEEVPVYGR
jgi:predicted nucleotidyltransferase